MSDLHKLADQFAGVIETQHADKPTEWGYSFGSHNPEPDDYVALASEEDAWRLDRHVRALTAQGEAVGEVIDYSYGQPIVRWISPAKTNIGDAIYAQPAPRVEVDEAMVERVADVRERLISAHISAFMDGTGTPKNATSDRAFCKSAMVDAVSLIDALAAALNPEAGRD